MKKNKPLILLFILVFCAQILSAQNNFYFVQFKNKLNNNYSINHPEAFLSAKSIARRTKQKIPIKIQDLPITASYKTTISNQGVQVFETSKWFNGVIIKSTANKAEQLKNLSFVVSITYLAPQNYAGRKAHIQKELEIKNTSVSTLFQNKILNINEMHAKGYLGNGISIAVLDGGFKNVNKIPAFNHLFAKNKLIKTYNFISKSNNVYQSSTHGTEVLSLMAAQEKNIYQGIAPEAEYMLFVTENASSEYRIEEYYWLIGAEKADSAGVDIINSSLGYKTFDDPKMNYVKEDMDGNTTITAKAAHIASEKGIIVVAAAGNEGNAIWNTIATPADIKNGLAVGSIEANYKYSTFSSLGPTADGRTKPDVVAMGGSVYLLNENGKVSQASGTSFSAPQVAALVAGVWQANPSLTALEMIEVIRNSATNTKNPNHKIGYGIPSFIAINHYLESKKTVEPIQIYPNPLLSSELLRVKITKPSKINQIQIFDLSGKKIASNLYTVSWSNNLANIQMQHLSKGLYFIKVVFKSNNKSENYNVRIIKL